MSARRDALDRWVADHPAGGGVDVAGAARRGSEQFRRWLILRTAVAVLLGAVVVAGLVGLRSVAGSVSFGARATAGLVVSPASGNAPLRATMDGSGSTAGPGAEITSYEFDFGDGKVTVQPTATTNHTYKAPGAYSVTLTVTDSAGRSAATAQEVTVTEAEPGDPTATLRIKPSSGPAPLEITARGSGSEPGQGAEITSYEFDFGDGTVRRQSKATIKHTYENADTYTVRLTVTNAAGRSDETAQEVTITEPEPGEPTAKLRIEPSSGPAPLEITARGSGSEPGQGAEITSYEFDFGDGSTTGPQDQADAQHTYKSPGTYTVKLTVLNSAGLSGETTGKVTVEDPEPAGPTPRLRVGKSSDPDATPLTVFADGSGSTADAGASYIFDFGDGTKIGPRSKPTAQHTYPSADTYEVTLTVINPTGAQVSTTEFVTVG